MYAIWVLAAGLLLAGCKLIDQTTFAPSPEEPAAKPDAPKADPRTPLITIGYATPDPNYQEILRYAVRAAETRVPGVQYDVIATLPAGADCGGGPAARGGGDARHHGAGRAGEPHPSRAADGPGGRRAGGSCLRQVKDWVGRIGTALQELDA